MTLAIPELGAGGAERVISLMANHWVERGAAVTLITLDSPDSDFYRLDARVRRIALGLGRTSGDGRVLLNTRRVRRLRRELRASSADVVVSFIEVMNVLTLLSATGLAVPTIVSERIDPRRFPTPRVRRVLRRVLYPRAYALVVQTERVRAWGERVTRHDRVRVIPNPVLRPPSAAPLDRPLPSGRLVAALGRLTWQKGFDVLLDAFARCTAVEPGWSLVVVGEGEERVSLERQAMRLGIADKVVFLGRVADPSAVFRRASLFVLSSRVEGFPNALAEAMACGLAVVSSDCDSGPAEIVRDGIDGILVPPENVTALADGMTALMRDGEKRARFAARAGEVVERFSLGRVMAMWDALVLEAAVQRRSSSY